jgi:Uma2 family endonuclease
MVAPTLLDRPQQPNDLLPLEPGDCLDQPTFHARYKAMPGRCKAELVEGVVYMPSPLKAPHGTTHPELIGWLIVYKAATPGTAVVDNATIIMGEQSEPQPDGGLLILPAYGGQTHLDEEEYIVGAPELIAEVSSSSAAIDLHQKRRDYERAGVREYIVLVLRENRIVWFVRRDRVFVEMAPGPDGIYRSEFFKGLWLDAQAMLRRDTAAVLAVLQQGLASADHAQFVASLRPR